MRVVEVGAAKVAYRVDGAGPGLVLVHGTGGNSDTNWRQLVGRLSESRMVVRPDYSGSGATIDDGAPLTIAALFALTMRRALKPAANDEPRVTLDTKAEIGLSLALERW